MAARPDGASSIARASTIARSETRGPSVPAIGPLGRRVVCIRHSPQPRPWYPFPWSDRDSPRTAAVLLVVASSALRGPSAQRRRERAGLSPRAGVAPSRPPVRPQRLEAMRFQVFHVESGAVSSVSVPVAAAAAGATPAARRPSLADSLTGYAPSPVAESAADGAHLRGPTGASTASLQAATATATAPAAAAAALEALKAAIAAAAGVPEPNQILLTRHGKQLRPALIAVWAAIARSETAGGLAFHSDERRHGATSSEPDVDGGLGDNGGGNGGEDGDGSADPFDAAVRGPDPLEPEAHLPPADVGDEEGGPIVYLFDREHLTGGGDGPDEDGEDAEALGDAGDGEAAALRRARPRAFPLADASDFVDIEPPVPLTVLMTLPQATSAQPPDVQVAAYEAALHAHLAYVRAIHATAATHVRALRALVAQQRVQLAGLHVAQRNLASHAETAVGVAAPFEAYAEAEVARHAQLLATFPADLETLRHVPVPPAVLVDVSAGGGGATATRSSSSSPPLVAAAPSSLPLVHPVSGSPTKSLHGAPHGSDGSSAAPSATAPTAYLSQFVPEEKLLLWAHHCGLAHMQFVPRFAQFRAMLRSIAAAAREESVAVLHAMQDDVARLQAPLAEAQHALAAMAAHMAALEAAVTGFRAAALPDDAWAERLRHCYASLHGGAADAVGGEADPGPVLAELTEHDRRIRDAVVLFSDSKAALRRRLQRQLRRISSAQSQIAVMLPELEVLTATLNGHSQAFQQILHVHRMGVAFGAALIEVVRRRTVRALVMRKAQDFDEVMHRVAASEDRRRAAFARQIARYLPRGLIRGLDDPVIVCRVTLTQTDETLPPLTRDDLIAFERHMAQVRLGSAAPPPPAQADGSPAAVPDKRGESLSKLQATLVKMGGQIDAVSMDFERLMVRFGLATAAPVPPHLAPSLPSQPSLGTLPTPSQSSMPSQSLATVAGGGQPGTATPSPSHETDDRGGGGGGGDTDKRISPMPAARTYPTLPSPDLVAASAAGTPPASAAALTAQSAQKIASLSEQLAARDAEVAQLRRELADMKQSHAREQDARVGQLRAWRRHVAALTLGAQHAVAADRAAAAPAEAAPDAVGASPSAAGGLLDRSAATTSDGATSLSSLPAATTAPPPLAVADSELPSLDALDEAVGSLTDRLAERRAELATAVASAAAAAAASPMVALAPALGDDQAIQTAAVPTDDAATQADGADTDAAAVSVPVATQTSPVAPRPPTASTLTSPMPLPVASPPVLPEVLRPPCVLAETYRDHLETMWILFQMLLDGLEAEVAAPVAPTALVTDVPSDANGGGRDTLVGGGGGGVVGSWSTTRSTAAVSHDPVLHWQHEFADALQQLRDFTLPPDAPVYAAAPDVEATAKRAWDDALRALFKQVSYLEQHPWRAASTRARWAPRHAASQTPSQSQSQTYSHAPSQRGGGGLTGGGATTPTAAPGTQHQLAFLAFAPGVLALFLPTRHPRAWAAFNIGAPHHFVAPSALADPTLAPQFRRHDFVLARIVGVQRRRVTADGRGSVLLAQDGDCAAADGDDDGDDGDDDHDRSVGAPVLRNPFQLKPDAVFCFCFLKHVQF
ncbi:hypothetical protein CXG81DRAFT_17752 [Caulochytrium protostelioides]|uniref:Autophagy-related protein 11 n=1 Tax=Caulochytrium protostelioides TaxID=1555241 RepID=A0A4P9XB37_9FUNG|nr:hypothetical protein CXG81DRAFT_17752 [Caulochytrium protostelioides]|eukprot:RKP02614.1 hypothetical protein CXG81DRAFT_17752 [Caulochytrium protostelioides]